MKISDDLLLEKYLMDEYEKLLDHARETAKQLFHKNKEVINARQLRAFTRKFESGSGREVEKVLEDVDEWLQDRMAKDKARISWNRVSGDATAGQNLFNEYRDRDGLLWGSAQVILKRMEEASGASAGIEESMRAGIWLAVVRKFNELLLGWHKIFLKGVESKGV